MHRILGLIDKTGVDLHFIRSGEDEIEEAFLRRLDDDRTRGALRAASWLNTQDKENNVLDVQMKVDPPNASFSDNT